MKKLSFLLSLATLLVFSTACSVENTDELIKKAVEAQENLESYYAEVTTTFNFEGEVQTSTYKEWNVKPDKYRMETDDTHISVSNGDTSWAYDKEENVVMVFDDLDEDALPEEDEEVPNESEIMHDMLTEMMNSNDVVVKGKETVADRNTVHLSLTPKEGQEEEDEFLVDMSYELWIDEETYMPLKMIMESDDFLTEMEYTHIEYNIEIDDALFDYEVPEGATVQTMEDLLPETYTLEELKEIAAFDLPDFTSIPEGYEFSEATYYEEMEMAVVEFGNQEDDLLMISITGDYSDFDLEVDEESEQIKVGDHEGTYMNMFDMQFITWIQNDLHVEVTSFSENFSKEELLNVAEGIK